MYMHPPQGLPIPPPAARSLLSLAPLSPDTCYLHLPHTRFFRNLYNMELWAPCMVNTSTLTAPQPVPEGWTLLKTIYLKEAGLTLPTPFVMVLQKGTMLSILIRGTETGDEWMVGECGGLCVGGGGLAFLIRGHKRLTTKRLPSPPHNSCQTSPTCMPMPAARSPATSMPASRGWQTTSGTTACSRYCRRRQA